MPESTSAPGPGWYPDPNDPATDRYWDGTHWTDSRTPHAPVKVEGEKKNEVDGTIIAGYIFAVLMPLIGFIIGLTQINRNRHGLWVVVVSVVMAVIYLAAFSSSSNTGY